MPYTVAHVDHPTTGRQTCFAPNGAIGFSPPDPQTGQIAFIVPIFRAVFVWLHGEDAFRAVVVRGEVSADQCACMVHLFLDGNVEKERYVAVETAAKVKVTIRNTTTFKELQQGEFVDVYPSGNTVIITNPAVFNAANAQNTFTLKGQVDTLRTQYKVGP